MTGRVAVLKAYGGDFELREYPVPEPAPGAILVRLTRAGVTVDSAGQPLAEGDRVTFLYFFPCGRCPVCLRD